MQNPYHAYAVLDRNVIDSDNFKSGNRPCAKTLNFWITRTIARSHKGMVPQRLDGTLHSNPEAKGHLRQIQINQIVAKLAHDIVAGGLPV